MHAQLVEVGFTKRVLYVQFKKKEKQNMNIRIVILFISTLSTVVVPQNALANDHSLRRFIGLWQAVDPDDGSLSTISIIKLSNDTVHLLYNDTYFYLCNGGRGLGVGNGTRSGRNAIEFSGITYTCEDKKIPPVNIPASFTLDTSGALIEVDEDQNRTQTIFYKTSR
jgi:hypothetical protein